jgi:DNA processing protein
MSTRASGVSIRKIPRAEFPAHLLELPDPPSQLYVRGTLPDPTQYTYLAVVGAREYTSYGKQACESIIRGLAGYPIAIVSGLALGIDSIAHRAALDAGLPTVAIPGSGLDDSVLYPACHRGLARDIVEHGGALLSEFDPGWKPRKESFPQRNRIMAGLSQALLVVEAAKKSGTLITARLALDYNRDVFAVPGPIFAVTSAGPHSLIKNGAACIERADDIVTALALASAPTQQSFLTARLSPLEQRACEVLQTPRSRDEVIRMLELPPSEANALLASLELKGMVIERLGLLAWAQ